jgi:hypothetical protein
MKLFKLLQEDLNNHLTDFEEEGEEEEENNKLGEKPSAHTVLSIIKDE